MTRPDLKADFNGWQVSDPTPQEKSEGNEWELLCYFTMYKDISSNLDPSFRGVLLWPHPCQGHQRRRAYLQVRCSLCVCRGQRRCCHFYEEERRQHIQGHYSYCDRSKDQHKEGGKWCQRRHHSSLQVPWRYRTASKILSFISPFFFWLRKFDQIPQKWTSWDPPAMVEAQ